MLIATHVVSDIEFIAREVMMLKRGVLLASAPPRELTAQINGRVWQWRIDPADLAAAQRDYRVTGISRDEESGEVVVRVLSETPPPGKASAVMPNLEDYYLHIFGETRRGEGE